MARLVSFVVLIAIIGVIGFVFFQVMAQFLIPVFLAVLLVIMFRPLHKWYAWRCNGRKRLAAALTTASILLIFLLPLTYIIFRAAREGVVLANNINPTTLLNSVKETTRQLREFTGTLGMELPADSSLAESMHDFITQNVASAALIWAGFVGNMLFGLAIMVISLYYFLVDGPRMILSLMKLSPLDERYENQLLEEFTTVTRAIVLASVVTAIVQGLMAGAAFLVLGVGAAFMLTALTMVLAMIPFVGAAAVWIPTSIWLYIHDGRLGAAVGLAIYGFFGISLIDNFLKPMILAGRSKLHPLLAFLSVLGGVKTLGPIGIVVGPMAVAFLQTLLVMLQSELIEMGKTRGTPPA